MPSKTDLDQLRWMNQCQRGMPWGRGHRDCGDWCPPRTQRYDGRICRKPDVCRTEGGCHMVRTAERLEEEQRINATRPAQPEVRAEELRAGARGEPTLGRRRRAD